MPAQVGIAHHQRVSDSSDEDNYTPPAISENLRVTFAIGISFLNTYKIAQKHHINQQLTAYII